MTQRTAPLRMQLNTIYSGPQAWFFLADARGYLRDEGLAIEFTEGDTAANTIPKMAAGGFDVGYGDINALTAHSANGMPNAPLAVFASYNASTVRIVTDAAPHSAMVPELYGMALMVAHDLANHEPGTVRKLLSAFNWGLVDTIADPHAAIDALVKRNPKMNRESNHRRLMGTLQLEMSRAEGGVLGIGDLDDARFARGIELLVMLALGLAMVTSGAEPR